MVKLSKTFPPLAAVAAALLGLLGAVQPLAAQEVDEVRISVVDPSSGEELAVLSPDESITMRPGDEVMLRTFEPQGNRRRPLAATFGFGAEASPFDIVSSAPERGEVVVRLTDRDPGDRHPHVGYKLGSRIDLSDEDMRLGRILVTIAPAESHSRDDRGGYGRDHSGGRYSRAADEVVRALYRGILLREPDDAAEGARREISAHGFDSVEEAADNIANSRESRGVDDNASAEQRLTALYRELLGWSKSDVDRDQWRSDITAIERGRLASVVDSMVNSDEFRSKFGF